MRCELVISSDEEERVVIYAKEHSPTISKIISLIEDDSHSLLGYAEDETVILYPDKIECITVLNGKTTAITQNGRFVLRERLYSLEEALGDSFIRINKSTLANIKSIYSFSASFGGTLMIKFKCGYCDYVSRRQLKTVKEKLK